MTIIQLIPTKQRLEQLHHEQKHHLYINTLGPKDSNIPRTFETESIRSTSTETSRGRSRARRCKRVTISKTFPFNSCNLVLLKDTTHSLNVALKHSMSRYGDLEVAFKVDLVSAYQAMDIPDKSYHQQVLNYYNDFKCQESTPLSTTSLSSLALFADNLNLSKATNSNILRHRERRRSLLKSVSLISSSGSECTSSSTSTSASSVVCGGLFSLLPIELIRRKLEDMIRECFNHISFNDPLIQNVTNLTINCLLQEYSIADEDELFMNIINKKNRQSIMETLEETFLYSYVNLMLFSLYDNFIFQLTNSSTLKNIISPDKPQLLYQFYRSLWKLDPDYYSSFPPDDIRHDYLRQHQFRPRDSQGVHEDLVDNFHDEAFIMNITKYYYTYGKELKHANKSLPFIRGVHPMNLDDEDDISQRWFESLVTSENDESDNDNATNKLTNAVVYTEDNRGRQLFTSDQNHDMNTSSDSSCSFDYPIADLDSETESNNFEVDAKLSHDGLFAATQKRILFLEDDDVLLFDKLDPPLYAFCDVRGISVDVLTRNIKSSSTI